jgi:hypothetical protein
MGEGSVGEKTGVDLQTFDPLGTECLVSRYGPEDLFPAVLFP